MEIIGFTFKYSNSSFQNKLGFYKLIVIFFYSTSLELLFLTSTPHHNFGLVQKQKSIAMMCIKGCLTKCSTILWVYALICSFLTRSFVLWSPLGSYLTTIHKLWFFFGEVEKLITISMFHVIHPPPSVS